MKRNTFGTSVKVGTSIDTLDRASVFFEQKKEVKIVKYYYCDEPSEREAIWIRPTDLKKCEVCSREIYHVKYDYTQNEDGTKKFSQKKHLVFIDNTGSQHYTCYGLNWCFKRIGFHCPPKLGRREDSLTETLPIPSFEEFHAIDDEDFNLDKDSAFIVSIRESYDSKVLPLLKKWMHKDINKTNVLGFMRDWLKVSDHLLFYDDDGKALFLRKIYNILGIYQE
jgi:hypothetical protein